MSVTSEASARSGSGAESDACGAVKSLKQLALLAFVRALERGAAYHGYLQLDLREVGRVLSLLSSQLFSLGARASYCGQW